MPVLVYQSLFDVPLPPQQTQPHVPMGWECGGAQCPSRVPPQRAGAIARGDDGAEAQYAVWYVTGWEQTYAQPPHSRPERSGAIARWEDGTESPYAVFYNLGGQVQSWQPPHPRPEKTAAILRGDDGIEFTYAVWYVTGWEIAPFQPAHPRPEKAASLFGTFPGIEGTLVLPVVALNYGFEIQPVQPPHPRPEQRSAGLVGGDLGTEAPFVYVPPPPPVITPTGGGGHRKPGKSIRPIWDRGPTVEPAPTPEALPSLPASAETVTYPAFRPEQFQILLPALATPRSVRRALKRAKKRYQLSHREADELLVMILALLEDEDED